MAVDYYTLCETAAITKLRSLTTYFPKPERVSTNLEDRERGVKYFAHFYPSTFQSSRVDGREKAITWAILIDLYVKYSTFSESMNLFKPVRAEVFWLFNSDPMLNKTPGVFNVSISAASEVMQDIAGRNPNFIFQSMSLAVSQRIRFGF